MTNLYVRVKKAGTGGREARRYKRISGKGKEGRGVKTGDIQGPFFVRPTIDGKQVWKILSAQTFADAKVEADQVALALEAQAKGLTVEEAEALTNENRIPIKTAVETYLEQKNSKAPKTLLQYQNTLNQFIESLRGRVRFLDEITVEVLRNYKRFLETEGYAGKTIDTRLNIVFFLLKKNRIEARIPKDEMPVVEEEPAVPYSEDELRKLFKVMTTEEEIRYKFFLGTGCRDKEVTFAAWSDIDFKKKTYHIRRKEDVGFTPKSHESRTVRLPESLITMLKARHDAAPHERWIFVNRDGKPDNHFLRKLKGIALRAGLNCKQCKTTLSRGEFGQKRKVEVSCKDEPVCEHFYLHRFRKTCATRWVEAGIPVRTVQHWLGHKNLETTMIYLGVTDNEKLGDNVDAAFNAAFGD